MKRHATAIWEGDLKHGNGALSLESGAFTDQPYSFQTRFEGTAGTNPEELIAAAHAGCFSMALSAQLGEAGMTPERILTTATVTLGRDGVGFAITGVHLALTARIPGASASAFEAVAQQAKEGCPISKALSVPISLTAQLENGG